MKKIFQLMKCLDIYGSELPIFYKGDKIYKTKLGGFLTILSSIICFTLILVYFFDLFSRSKFSIIVSNKLNYNEEIDFSNIPILFSIADLNGNLLDLNEKYFTIEPYVYSIFIDYESGKNNIQFKKRKIDFDRCDKIQNKTLINQFYPDFNLTQYFCLNPDQDLIISGRYGDLIHGNKAIRIYINRPKDFKPGLQSPGDLPMSELKLHFFYVHNRIDQFQKGTKAIYFEVQSEIFDLSIRYMKKYYLTFEKGYYTIDNGYVFVEKKTHPFYQFEEYRMDFDTGNNHTMSIEEPSFGYIAIHASENTILYSKSYVKLTSVLANLGGLIHILIQAFYYLNYFISNNIMEIDILTNLSIQENIQMNSTSNTQILTSSLNLQSKCNTNSNSSNTASFLFSKNFHKNKGTNTKKYFKWYDFILPIKTGLSKKSRFFRYLSRIIYHSLGIEIIFKTNYEFEKLFGERAKNLLNSSKSGFKYFENAFGLSNTNQKIYIKKMQTLS